VANALETVKKIPQRALLLLERARAKNRVVDITMRTFKTFSEDDGGSYAAALTYYTFFSIFPLLLFSAAILGFLTEGNEVLRKEIIDAGLSSVPLLRDVLSPDGLAVIENGRQKFAITGTVLALYSGTGAVVALQRALNRFHGVSEEPNWVGKRIRALKLLALFAAGALISIVLGGLSGYATNIFAEKETLGGREVAVNVINKGADPPSANLEIGGRPFPKVTEGTTFAEGYVLESVSESGDCVNVSFEGDENTLCEIGGQGVTVAAVVGRILGHLTGFIVGVLLFGGAYRFLPAVKRSFRDVLPGALIAAGLFEILKEVGAWYIQRGAAGREATFGVFAISAALLVACFLISQITLLCAEMNDVIIERRLTRQSSVALQEEA
jgi:uncharacterized BrkB/YihY/UPF0761 family membrane protein